MNIEEALASAKQSFTYDGPPLAGDEWSCAFKSEAISTLIAEVEKCKALRAIAATGTAVSFLALSDEDKRNFFAIAVDDSSRRKRAEELVKYLADRTWIESERDRFARLRLDDLDVLNKAAADYR